MRPPRNILAVYIRLSITGPHLDRYLEGGREGGEGGRVNGEMEGGGGEGRERVCNKIHAKEKGGKENPYI